MARASGPAEAVVPASAEPAVASVAPAVAARVGVWEAAQAPVPADTAQADPVPAARADQVSVVPGTAARVAPVPVEPVLVDVARVPARASAGLAVGLVPAVGRALVARG
ncbi:hypothetical protein [Verrucosispora sp. FIM060022]|uniref:hypothetical protein n=1 Tax=Verrucosispora sp. FIM060022 TaxID=1479020 RepID=UPI000F88F119|nr:hypothetical protein [Verrucosispora sp. FIM060022]